VVDTSDVTADCGDVGVEVGIPTNAGPGAVAYVELGHNCDEGDASTALRALKDWDCDLRRAFREHRPMFYAHATANRRIGGRQDQGFQPNRLTSPEFQESELPSTNARKMLMRMRDIFCFIRGCLDAAGPEVDARIHGVRVGNYGSDR
jgi:hypothetical protein